MAKHPCCSEKPGAEPSDEKRDPQEPASLIAAREAMDAAEQAVNKAETAFKKARMTFIDASWTLEAAAWRAANRIWKEGTGHEKPYADMDDSHLVNALAVIRDRNWQRIQDGRGPSEGAVVHPALHSLIEECKRRGWTVSDTGVVDPESLSIVAANRFLDQPERHHLLDQDDRWFDERDDD